MTLDNPAARLLRILENGKKNSSSQNNRVAWCALLNVKIEDKALLMGRLGKVMSLSADIIERLNSIDGLNVDRHIHWARPLDNAFSKNNLNASWHEFITYIDVHVINYLSATADLLSHKMVEPTIDKIELEQILQNSKDLIVEIKKSDIPQDIKSNMLKYLYKVCLAIEEYQITGASNISIVTEIAFGHGVLYSDSIDIAKSNNTAKKFWQFMGKLALIVSVSAGVQQLSPTVLKMLPNIDFETYPESNNELLDDETENA
jgi:hypothetical protein